MEGPPPNPEALFAALNQCGVDAVLVGGMAVYLHGGNNITMDMDIAFLRTKENYEKLADALELLEARPVRWRAPKWRLDQIDLVSGWLHLTSTAGQIDLLAKHPGIEYGELRETALDKEIGDTHLTLASIDALIKMKSAAGRERDAAHLELLRAAKQALETSPDDPDDPVNGP